MLQRTLAAVLLAWLACFATQQQQHQYGAHAQELCSIPPESYAPAKTTHPQFANAITELEKHSIATWYSDRNGDYAATMRALVNRCPATSRLSVVVYGLPNKDCEAGYSTLGSTVKTAADYVQFLTTLTSIIGDRKVLYVLEPDAVGLLAKTGGCGEKFGYGENLKTAIRLLSANTNADIYLDIGYWTLQWPELTKQLTATFKTLVGAGRVKGIAINTSNYRSNAELAALCSAFQTAMGSTAYRCVVDTSRNFVAPTSNEWCNVKTAGIGHPPTSNTGYSNLDYFMWIKPPGESDGECNDGTHSADSLIGPNASVFFPESFRLLWNQGYFVQKRQFPAIASASVQPACAASYGFCGNAAQGTGCCASSSDYCQPWNPDSYQCRPIPATCGKQQVGIDFYGDDLAAIYGVLPEECCERCASAAGCKAYTFVNFNSDGRSACYLKTGAGSVRYVAGVVSAVIAVNAVATPQPDSSTGCTTPSYGRCGNDQVGPQCCPSGEYCQPWDPGFYQCRTAPLLCGAQQVGVDFYGNDLTTIYAILPEECCATCANTEGCRAYTFVNYNSDGRSACYLKSSAGGRRTGVVGVVSGEVLSPKAACSTAVGAFCGNSQSNVQCCPSGSYCQPWNANYYQCIQTPPRCPQQLTNVDFYGNDIGSAVHNLSPAGCCAKCADTPGCKAYTFVNEGTPACYLKSSTSGKRSLAGAVSGIIG